MSSADKAVVQVERLSLVRGQGERGSTLVTESRDRVSTDQQVIAWGYLQNTVFCQQLAKLPRYEDVLGLARTGLIFIGIQQGAQLGGLTPPGQTEQGIPYHVLSCWVPVGGSWGAGTHLQLGSARHQSGPGEQERLCGLCGLCCVFSLSVSLLFLFPLFAVLLNCPYSDPPVSACFFAFSSAPWRGKGGCMALLLPSTAKP